MSKQIFQPRTRVVFILLVAVALILVASSAASARDKPNAPSEITPALKWWPAPQEWEAVAGVGKTGGNFSKVQIERFVCESSGDPSTWVDMSCNVEEFGQDWAPDNEIAIVVNPDDPMHLVAGSNDYFYRFNNATGSREAMVPTGFFTSFDGGETWTDGQIPMRTGNSAGDPVPAFDRAHGVVLMAQLENTAGHGGPWITQGDVSVSRSADGGLTWSEPVTVMKGNGAALGPATNATFWDKEWIAVDNNPDSPFYGRAYVTATAFMNGLQGTYVSSPIFLSYSDDGGLTWTEPAKISGFNPAFCTYQETGPAGECDEDQFSIPAIAPDGTVYVHFANAQNEAEWERLLDFDSQIMVVKSSDGGASFGKPVPVVQLEDGLHDMPWSVILRQTVWGHQIRWNALGNLTLDPTDPDHLTVVFADRGTPNGNARTLCWLDVFAGVAGANRDPCGAGPGADTDVYRVDSFDGGETWGPRVALAELEGHGWFPWADYLSDGTLVVAWDQDATAAPADIFHHVLKVGAGPVEVLGPDEQPGLSATHWAGQYTTLWPTICGPAGSDTPGKGCNVFHGDYTGLAIGSDDSINVVWTGLNVLATTPQVDFYTGELWQGYRQDAMFARR